MTGREEKLCKAVLQALHDADGGQHDSLTLHAEANLIRQMSLAEFNAALKICDGNGWVTGIASRLNRARMKWNINDAGEAALLEL